MSIAYSETGQDFELRALHTARSIHDPFGLQGAIMHKGKERDGVFIDGESVHVYEFTVGRDKAKAEKDAAKIVEMLVDLRRESEHQFKSFTGWFVTLDEPTAVQRGAVDGLARSAGLTIHPISVSVLQQRICNSEEYLRCRDNAPFGSTAYAAEASQNPVRVEPLLLSASKEKFGISDITRSLLDGSRMLITGDFGVGKSFALRELYRQLRREHFRRKKVTPFPVHINLRDCAGLRTPAEILRRHAEDIGFKNEKSLISAWRAGACVLLLDGFDEVVPMRWLGGAADLRGVRWGALSPIRRLIDETPTNVGLIACGRSHYFSTQAEMGDALGYTSSSSLLNLLDFDADQVHEYLKQAKVDWTVPSWIPTRPLLMSFLLASGELDNSGEGIDRASSWRNLLEEVCRRESKMFVAVRPQVIKAIMARVATLARSTGDEIGPVSMDLMRRAFIDVNGRQPDEEGLQLLLRLPGLAIEGGGGATDNRLFADRDLADAAYGEDLGEYLTTKFEDHPLASVASWVSASSDLAVQVAAHYLEEHGGTAKGVLAAASQRQNLNKTDAVLADMLGVAGVLGSETSGGLKAFVIDGVIFRDLTVTGDDAVQASISFRDCVFQRVDVSSIDNAAACPHFEGGMIGLLDGVSTLPPWMLPRFNSVEIDQFSSSSQTTAGILQLKLRPRDRVALTILKKIYGQAGSGRKEGALSRGLDQGSREMVPDVIGSLVSEGWIQKSSAGRNVLYVGVKGRRASALRALDVPAEFRLP